MKKLKLLLAILIIASYSTINAQGLFYETGLYETKNLWSGYSYYLQGNNYMHSKAYKKKLEKTGIVGYERTVSRVKKGKLVKRSSETVKFDNNFNLIDKNNGKKHFTYGYNEDNRYTEYQYIKKGKKLKKHELIEYNDSSRIKKYVYYKHNGEKLKNKWIAEYGKDSKHMLSKVYYTKDGVAESRHWDYEYYEDGKQKQTKYYKKGELKHIWNYTCDDEGKQQKKDIATTQICRVTEYLDDSSYVIVNRTTNKKGKIRKNVTKYNKYKKVLERNSYNNKGKLIYGTEFNYDHKQRLISSITYKRGGVIRWKQEWYFNSNDLVSKTKKFKRKGKLRFVYEYTYNNNMQLIERASFDKKQQQYYKYKFEYNSKGNIVKTNKYNKKDKLVRVYETKFSYK